MSKHGLKNNVCFMLKVFQWTKPTYYTLTAYLVDPKIICSVGRTKEEFKHEAAGTNLYLKNGTHNILIPKHESDLANTNWTLGACFPSMGTHYWYSTSKDMNCKEFQPFFLLYNRKKFTAFGFVAFGGWEFSSYRYEQHPPKLTYRLFMKEVPKCIPDVVEGIINKIFPVVTLHVYLNFKPWNIIC
uniref:Uncharacterized protein n=1 Tax=Strigamia maritima TaxID=126957 RepID=T1IRJ5_STRMM